MREIKFRQALVVDGEFCGWHYWGFIDDSFVCPGAHGCIAPKDALEYSHQYTGLKDKNGKEIYEGDVVTSWNTNPEFDFWQPEYVGNAVVEITPESGVYMRYRQSNGVDFGFPWTDNNTIWGLRFVEVIGNIYENPELGDKP